ncbi:Spy/CpxP family protein refolding chaperone [Crocosphaera sp. XPORK-15E]|uniref:Spy/CpxP family protein refolding chaperone n=1 Tax=Crocosphaera sp. XPORK-15E TaxID=3110247 RepID=UPI002B1F982D|nr:Spy/CpxP family protein refolding chaperone [Crocosphaera sp. XPORK-15E]MEA5533956.1 Spy/CpxP family protein refolding chaperone [Crocosphaera sp. XPORK-15E]
MIVKETALILLVVTLGIGGTVALADSVKETPSSMLIAETQVIAQRGEREGREGRGAEKFMEQLKLSDEQLQQLNAIRQKYNPQMEQLQERIRKTGEELSQMMQGNASDTALQMKHKDMSNLRQEMGNLRFESMLQMRKVLTPEQRQQFAQLMQQRRQQGGWNRGNREENP